MKGNRIRVGNLFWGIVLVLAGAILLDKGFLAALALVFGLMLIISSKKKEQSQYCSSCKNKFKRDRSNSCHN